MRRKGEKTEVKIANRELAGTQRQLLKTCLGIARKSNKGRCDGEVNASVKDIRTVSGPDGRTACLRANARPT